MRVELETGSALEPNFRSVGNQLVLRRVDGTGALLDIGLLFPREDGLDLGAVWAPDGQSIMVVEGKSKVTASWTRPPAASASS